MQVLQMFQSDIGDCRRCHFQVLEHGQFGEMGHFVVTDQHYVSPDIQSP